MQNPGLAVIILAAGSSSRLGSSKQLLVWNGKTLLGRTIDTARDLGPSGITVVLGSNAEGHKQAIDQPGIDFIINPLWEKGMGSSIKSGVRQVTGHSSPDAILILVCDQPMLSAAHLKKLIDHQRQTQKKIIASWYGSSPGVPVLFQKEVFSMLLNMDDAMGAKKIIQQNIIETETVPFPEGEFDIDTPSDVERLLNK